MRGAVSATSNLPAQPSPCSPNLYPPSYRLSLCLFTSRCLARDSPSFHIKQTHKTQAVSVRKEPGSSLGSGKKLRGSTGKAGWGSAGDMGHRCGGAFVPVGAAMSCRGDSLQQRGKDISYHVQEEERSLLGGTSPEHGRMGAAISMLDKSLIWGPKSKGIIQPGL